MLESTFWTLLISLLSPIVTILTFLAGIYYREKSWKMFFIIVIILCLLNIIGCWLYLFQFKAVVREGGHHGL